MSTTASSSSRARPTPSQQAQDTSNNGSNGSNPGLAQSSSILFGFLITFIVLFIAFMACGIGTRRNRRARRLNALTGIPGNAAAQMQPELWDVWVSGSRRDVNKWEDMMPLSTSFKLSSMYQDIDAEDSVVTPTPAPGIIPPSETPLWGITADPPLPEIVEVPPHRPFAFRRQHDDHISELPLFRRAARRAIAFLLYRARRPRSEPTQEDGGIEGLHVSVMIAMPSPRHQHPYLMGSGVSETDGSDRAFGEVALGVADIPWSKALR